MALRDPLEKARAQPMGDDITYAQWIGDPRRYATREQTVAFHNLALREQIVPLIERAIQRYDERRRWYRRLGRWLAGLVSFRRSRSREEAVRVLTEIERRRMADELTLARFPESEAPRDG